MTLTAIGSNGDRPTTPGPADGTSPAPHARPWEQVAAALAVEPAVGLEAQQVGDRLTAFGGNRLAEPERRAAWRRFLDQFRSLLIVILLGAAVLAGVVGDLKDTVVIAVVLVVNASIGFVMENRAERSLEALRTMLTPTARVRRGGEVAVVDAGDLVPGDIVLLEAGNRVPADGRFVVAESVEIDESALTGESQPVAKSSRAVTPSDGEAGVPLADRTSMAYMNTALTRGRAELVVTATGMRTEVGAIAAALQTGKEPPSPLQLQLDSVGKRIALIGGVAVSAYVVLALLRGDPLSELALSAVALAVATVPEGLPAVLALTLALGVARMARRGAIVKRLASVETLGAATVICSDKTGTLTLNQMTARQIWFAGRRLQVDGHGYEPVGALRDASGAVLPGAELAGVRQRLLAPLALCSDTVLPADGSVGIIGDPTEGALVVLAAKAGLDVAGLRVARPRLAEMPFDAAHKFMVSAHSEDDPDGAVRLYVKGAPDVLLARSAFLLTDDGVVPLDDVRREQLAAEVTALASGGLRVLAAATTLLDELPAGPDGSVPLADRVGGLTLLGLVGIADPPRPQAKDAIAVARRAGIAVKMITGDHRDTAATIAREIGIEGDVITGADLDRMSPRELADGIEHIGVFARVAPEHKVAIVQALRSRGHVVAMTGDGVNDAAALRVAHIGVAMGVTGTEVTKEAGDMVLTDDDFATIVRAVREGRSIFDNIVKFIRFQLSTNIGAILTFLGAQIVGLPSPLTAIQVLWVNIIMDGPPAMALGVDPARTSIMDDAPRRPDDRVLNRRRLLRMFRAGAVMALGTLSVLAWARDAHGEAVALTMTFTTFVLFQFFNALNARAEVMTVFTRHLFTNRWLWASFGVVVVLQVLVVQVAPLAAIFDTTALTLVQWLTCLVVASSVLWVDEAAKLVARQRVPES